MGSAHGKHKKREKNEESKRELGGTLKQILSLTWLNLGTCSFDINARGENTSNRLGRKRGNQKETFRILTPTNH